MSISLEVGITPPNEEVPSYAYHPPNPPQGTSVTLSGPLQDLCAEIFQVVILRFIYHTQHLKRFLIRQIFMVLLACGNSRQQDRVLLTLTESHL